MWKLLVALVALLAVPGAQACQGGQVVPLVDLEFPEKSSCRVDQPCDPLPGQGESREYGGTVKWSWDVDQCTVQNGMPGGEVTIEIGETTSTPDWMRVEADPPQIVIETQEQFDPRNLHIEDATGNPRVYFQVEKPVTVTFTRLGAVDEISRERIEGRDGILPMFLKAESRSGTTSVVSFGIEEFRFDASGALENDLEGRPMNADDESTPWPLPVTALALLGALFVRRR